MGYDVFNEPQRCAFHESLNKQAASLSAMDKFGVVNLPLLNIPLDHIALDELHLLLRITDVLLRNIIMMVKFDRSSPATNHLQKVINVVTVDFSSVRTLRMASA